MLMLSKDPLSIILSNLWPPGQEFGAAFKKRIYDLRPNFKIVIIFKLLFEHIISVNYQYITKIFKTYGNDLV